VYVVPHAGTIEDWVGRTFRSIVDATTDHAQAQADAVMQLLTASSPTRTKVAAAVTNLGKCKRLKQGASVLGAASAERRKSLVRAEALAVDDLSEGDQLKNQLVSAFKHSKAADDAYRRWAQALSTRGCKSSVRNGSDRRRGDAESAVATAAKKQVARLWNQIGPAYGHGKVSYQNI
jgi:hypothetical protein